MRYASLLLLLLVLVMSFYSCATQETHLIVSTNYSTNYSTNISFVTNGVPVVDFSLSITDGATVQYVFRIFGVIPSTNQLQGLFADVSNVGVFNAIFTSSTNFYIPIVLDTNMTLAYVVVSSVSTNGDTYSYGFNLFVSNIPSIRLTNILTNFLITSTDINVLGIVEISKPDSITDVVVFVSNSVTNFTNYSATNLSTSWTNLVEALHFSNYLSLAGGFNYVKVRAVSSRGVSSETSLVVLKSLFLIDGNYEASWDSAKLLAYSTGTNYLGYGLASVRITNDSFFLYIFVSNRNIPNLGANGLKVSISIDTNSTSGVSNDAWVGATQPGRFVFEPTNGNYPDIQIQMRLKNSNEINGAAVYLAYPPASPTNWTNVANTWTPNFLNGCMFGANNSFGWEAAIPLSLIGLDNGSVISTIVVLGRPDGDDRNSALFVLPESPSNEITTNDGYFTNVIRVWSSNYTISY